jgi:hypothetical protein
VRKMTLGVALVSVLALSIPGVAMANIADSTLDVSMKLAPAKPGTKKKPRPVALTLGMAGGTKSGTGQASTSTRLDIQLPKGIAWNGKKWPKKARCSIGDVAMKKSTATCPKGAIVGKGHVTALGGNGAIVEEIDVTAFVTEAGDLGLFLKADVPVALRAALNGKVTGQKISVAIPSNIQEPVPGVPTAIKSLRFTLSGKTKVDGKTRGIIESNAPAKRWTLKLTNVMRDGSLTDSATVAARG